MDIKEKQALRRKLVEAVVRSNRPLGRQYPTFEEQALDIAVFADKVIDRLVCVEELDEKYE